MSIPASGSKAVDLLHQSRYRFVIAALLLAAHLTVGVNLFAVAPILLPIIQDYDINLTTAGLLVALVPLVAAGFGLPGGIVTVKLGLRRAFIVAWFLMGLAALSAVAPNYLTLMALRLAYGLGIALVFTASGPLLLQWFRPREVLIMNGLNTAALSLGIALSVSTAAPLAGLVGWQFALGIYGSSGVIGAVAWLLAGKAPGETTHALTTISFSDVRAIISNKAILLLLAADAGVLIQYTALSAWLPTFYAEVRAMSPARAGFVAGLLPTVGVFAVLLGGFLPLRFGSARAFLIAPGLLVVVGGVGAFGLSNTAAVYASIILVGIGSWLYVPTLLSMTMDLVGRDPKGVALVWGSLITVSGFGMFLSPIVVGFIRDLTGSFLPGFYICAVAALSLLLAGILMPRTQPITGAA
ncbi:MAG: MFS transporter [Chloroflexi bacterium]|nr:MFS transporter [Chloroflexota bacterium]